MPHDDNPHNFLDSENIDWLLHAYRIGVFPMAESATDPRIFWCDPPKRGVIMVDEFHVPRRLAALWRKGQFEIQVNYDFENTVRSCAEATKDRPSTWINKSIFDLYCRLHMRGYAHSIELYQDKKMVGGVYGVSLGRIFFGESMFSRVDNASKIALCSLMARLWAGNYKILDTQFLTKYLQQFGAKEISRKKYREFLQQALQDETDHFPKTFPIESSYSESGSFSSESELVSAFLQSRTQTS